MKPGDVAALAWEKERGLLPAVVQHARSGVILMLGYMNRESLEATLTTGRVTFWSRSRQRLWTKGETSGSYLLAIAVCADCDRDSLLVQALPAGPVCHAGTATCYPAARASDGEALAFLGELGRVVAERFATRPEGSYTARLHAAGPSRMAQKVGEEALEFALAGVGDDKSRVLAEAADLLYHVTVLLQQRGLALADVAHELELRHANGR
ncbi:MAG: bifunctional phosphoribosyl-AMP cyclohydrolase/phosphoribosyl-ATP diphosphatase HisIE [Steroidobacteraceae bacterium]